MIPIDKMNQKEAENHFQHLCILYGALPPWQYLLKYNLRSEFRQVLEVLDDPNKHWRYGN